MQIVILENSAQIGDYAANRILREIETGAIRVLGVATGSSPLPLYSELARRQTPAVSKLQVFALDEYVGLPVAHSQSYHSVINRDVTVPLGIDPQKVHVPNGQATNIVDACLDFEAAIGEAGGIDLQILGIGSGGHIGFNEPTSSLTSRTRIKTLTSETRHANARFFGSFEEVPTHCITQGLGTIMEARQTILLAQGVNKASAVAQMIEGPMTSMCPASILQMHPDVTVILDTAAAANLVNTSYYEYVFRNRPSWQR